MKGFFFKAVNLTALQVEKMGLFNLLENHEYFPKEKKTAINKNKLKRGGCSVLVFHD